MRVCGACSKEIPPGCWHEHAESPPLPVSQRPSRREVLIAYLEMMTDANDWHAVSDAATDLRELDAEERGRRKV